MLVSNFLFSSSEVFCLQQKVGSLLVGFLFVGLLFLLVEFAARFVEAVLHDHVLALFGDVLLRLMLALFDLRLQQEAAGLLLEGVLVDIQRWWLELSYPLYDVLKVLLGQMTLVVADDVGPVGFLPHKVARAELALHESKLELEGNGCGQSSMQPSSQIATHVNILYMALEMRRLVVLAAANCAGVVLLSGVVQHVHFQVGLVDEAFVALWTLHFGLRLVVADGVELE